MHVYEEVDPMGMVSERLRTALPPFGRRAQATEYVALDRHACDACWRCLEVCPNDVFGKVGLHRHAVIRDRDACTGCLVCVEECLAGALTSLDGPESGDVA
jgi:2-oxoglutarate ferredoxin oxidoreductase subunit delta